MPGSPVTDASDSFCGFFGKLPSHGDFLRRNLPGDAAGRLQAWLQEGFSRLGDLAPGEREQRMATAPAWRFPASPGLIAREAVTGVMVASRDKVGRVYPCLALASLGASDAASAANCGRWSEHVEMLVRTAVAQGLNGDHLAEALLELGRPEPAGEPRPFEVATIDAGVRVDVEATPTLAGNMVEAARATAPADGAVSLWWRVVGPSPCMFWLRGLPVDEVFESLFASPAAKAARTGSSSSIPSP
jgi:type VI secretion system protein ImpM